MKNIKNSSGMTLLEVLLALVVFSIVSVSIMSLIGNVDRLRIRNKRRDHASIIAANAAELLKYYGKTTYLNDSLYTVNISGSEYHVERKRLDDQNDLKNLYPIEIRVSKNGELVKSFKLLQGSKKDTDE